MVFSDLLFLFVFLLSCFIIYFAVKSIKAKNIVLIVYSLIFYAWGEPIYVCLLLLSTVVNYICGLLIDRYRDERGAKLTIASALVFNIGLLLVFKYTGFFVENINALLGTSITVPNIRLPIGISFFTFQILSYIIDCYWGKVEVQRSYPKLLLYISLFPQLVAGPIVRYSTIEKEISSRRSTAEDISEGLTRFIVGLSKKVIFANGLYAVVEELLGAYSAEVAYLGSSFAGKSFFATTLGVICFALYVYYDFSGYSDMAIGIGRIFGFRFDENFKHPFVSKNITEFWQRWHISLGSFFRDYLLYVPLFGKRRKYLSLFLVWFCTGFWHGASWNFIIWGMYFGAFVFIEQLIGKKRMKKIPVVLTNIYALFIIIIGFGIFYFENLKDLGTFFKNLVFANGNSFIEIADRAVALENIFLIVISAICSMPILPWIKKKLVNRPKLAVAASYATTVTSVCLLIVCSVLLAENASNPFLYFRF
ncbi:MAG: MBOAT family protein [Ruminococcaceae bacterium]|nr:MBOAT family protein [Oscillospiraceae bacterium]